MNERITITLEDCGTDDFRILLRKNEQVVYEFNFLVNGDAKEFARLMAKSHNHQCYQYEKRRDIIVK